jgi:hypothetical protein
MFFYFDFSAYQFYILAYFLKILVIYKEVPKNLVLLHKQNVEIGGGLFCQGLGFETWFHYITQAGLKFMIFLPQPPKCWGYRSLHTQPE